MKATQLHRVLPCTCEAFIHYISLVVRAFSQNCQPIPTIMLSQASMCRPLYCNEQLVTSASQLSLWCLPAAILAGPTSVSLATKSSGS